MAQIQENRGINMKKLFLITATVALLFTGCSLTGMSAPKNSAEAIAQAKVKYNMAHEQKIAWNKTKKLIAKAEKLAKEGKEKEAIAVANMAAYEADTAMAESKEFDKTWQSAVIK